MFDRVYPKYVRAITVAAATAVMALFLLLMVPVGQNRPFTVVLFSVLYGLALCYISMCAETEQPLAWGFAALALAALVYIRVCLVPYISNDYQCFLVNWIGNLRGLSFGGAMRTPIGDYNLPYLYILWLISRFPTGDLVMIKFVSCLFDLLLACAVKRIASFFTTSKTVRLALFLAAFALPTVVLNSAMWGQCDSIYAACCLFMLYHILKKNGSFAVIWFSVAFAFKLQTVFLAPALIACLFCGRVKARHLAWFPIVNLAASLPAMVCGRSPGNILKIYLNQTVSYPHLDMNAPSFYRLFSGADFSLFDSVGVMTGGLAALGILYLVLLRRERMTDRAILKLFFLSALLVPYFLPRMHERYFFLADVLVLLVVLLDRKKWPWALITVFASFNAYAYYLFGGVTLVNYTYVSLALFAVAVLAVRDFLAETAGKEVPDGTHR